jgi:hypothetical protein
LNKVFDQEEKKIAEQLPLYLKDLLYFGALDSKAFKGGLQRYLRAVPDLIADYPKLTEYLSKTIITLFDANALKQNEIIWADKPEKEDDEDEQITVDMYNDFMKDLAEFITKEGSYNIQLQ